MKRWLFSLLVTLATGCAFAATAPATVKADYDVYKDGLHIATVAENFDQSGDRTLFQQAETRAHATESIARMEFDWAGAPDHVVQIKIGRAHV